MKKLLVLGMGAVLTTALVGCTDASNKNEVAKTKDGFEVTESTIIETISKDYGIPTVQSAIYKTILQEKFAPNDKELEAGMKTLETTYADYGGIEGLKSYYGYSDEELESLISYDIALKKAAKKYKGITDADIKKFYEENAKSGKRVIEIISLEGKLDKKYVDGIKNVKTLKDAEKLVGEDTSVTPQESKYAKGLLTEDLSHLAKLKVGESEVITDSTYGTEIAVIVVEDVEMKFEEVRESIETKLLFEGMENYEAWIFAKLAEDFDVKLDSDYKDYEVDLSVLEEPKAEGTAPKAEGTENTEKIPTATDIIEEDKK